MRTPMICWALLLLVLFGKACNGFYLPGSYMHTYSTGDEIVAKVNSLTSIETELPFSYYSLPYCQPHGGIKKSAENLGELLMGDQIDNSPYRFRMNVNESVYLCTTKPLSEHEVKLLKQRTRDLYQVNMILDNLPVMRYAKQNGIDIQWTGFPVGYTPQNSNDDYIINHLKFTVLVHEYEGSGVEVIGTGEEGMGMISESDKKKASGFEIVGFVVVPCSVKYDPEVMTKHHIYDNISLVDCPSDLDKSQIIREQERISFTYVVEFVKSDIRWPSRWDAYLKMEGARVHWFSILNSLMVIFFLAGIVFVIFLRTVRRDLTRYEELDKEAQAQMNEELSGWKLVVGDVFREPDCPKLLCVMVGDGVQITGMAVVTIVFAAFGFMSPASRGMLLTGMILLYLFLGIAAGYAAVRMWSRFPVGKRSSTSLRANPQNHLLQMGGPTHDSSDFLTDKSAKIFVAGHRGLVGSAIVRKLQSHGLTNLVLRSHSELDLTRQSDVDSFFAAEKPQYVILAAAKVGGIHANNTYPADFIAINLQIQTNVIDSSFRHGVKKLLFLGSSCIYPKLAPQPIPENALLTGPLEPTNEWYAIAKISGIKMCQAYRIQYNWDAISGMPTNLYGPNDNFHPENSHVLPALMRRFHEAKVNKAKEVVVWGTGSPLREFLHVDDLADAVVFLMDKYSGLEHLNVGSGKEVTIKELAELVKEAVGFEGELVWDTSKPDGTPRKLMDSSKLLGLGWMPKISLKDGLVDTYKWYVENVVKQ